MPSRPLALQIAPGQWAGHMRIFHRQCLALHSGGYDLRLLAHPLNGERLDARVPIESLGALSAPTLSWRLGDRVRRCCAAYRMASVFKPDVIQFYSPEFIPWAIRLKRRKNCPLIFDCMEDFIGYARQRGGVPGSFRACLGLFVKKLLAAAARHCDAIIVADEGTGTDFRGSARRVVVLHNFPSLEAFKCDERTNRECSWDLIYHGSMPRYHLAAVLKIDDALVASGRKLTWRLLGHLPDLEWFQSELTVRGANNRFSIDPLIPYSQIPAEIRRARVGIVPLPDLPKFQKNIPQKMFEYMAMGVPLLVSDLPPVREFFKAPEPGFLVGASDYRGFADRASELVSDSRLRHEKGRNGRAHVVKKWNWEVESRKLIQLYEAVQCRMC